MATQKWYIQDHLVDTIRDDGSIEFCKMSYKEVCISVLKLCSELAQTGVVLEKQDFATWKPAPEPPNSIWTQLFNVYSPESLKVFCKKVWQRKALSSGPKKLLAEQEGLIPIDLTANIAKAI